MLQPEGTVFRTPRRQRRLIQREGNVGRRRSLFSESKESDDDIATLSPTSSEVGTPSASPIIAVKSLENNFNQLLLDRTPVKSPPGTPAARISPKIRGIKCLSEDTDVIKTNTFYGGKSFTSASVDGKTLYDYVRAAVPLKARTKLFPDDAPKEPKKRGRTASFLDSAKRPKKKPRLQDSLPCTAKVLVKQKLEKLKNKLAMERAFKKKKKKISKKGNLDEMTVYAEKKPAKKEDTQPPVKRKYNWEIFSTGSERQFFRSLNSSVTMTPPSSTNKKKKLMSNNVDFLITPKKALASDSEEEDTDVLIDAIKKDVISMIQDEDKDVRIEVDNLLLQLDEATTEQGPAVDASDDEGDENNDPNAVPSTPSQSIGASPLATPSSQPKFYPVFSRTPSSGTSSSSSVLVPKKSTPQTLKGVGLNQMLLDCGQSKLREVECPVCQLVYVQGVAEDEDHHLKYHSTVTQMKYTGFKNERIAGIDGPNKVVMVRMIGEDARIWKKALDYKRVVDAELGAPTSDTQPDQVYLYIKDKQVMGLLSAVMLSEANRLLPLSDALNTDPNIPSLCSEESYPAKCGITRLWVSPNARKQGIATAMANALRRNFMFGTILDLDDIALSSPTADGRIFGFKYFKRNDFLVY
uniref:N-acetyltransferase ESCO2 n=1 Tax=Lygus hesperus TaxID=30085 RepID=A0A0K8STR2_LYGHE